MTRRIALFLVAGILLMIGLVQGFESRGELCGSVFKPSESAALYDTLAGTPGGEAASCRQSISDAKPLTYGLLGIGAVAGLLGIVAGGPAPAKRPENA